MSTIIIGILVVALFILPFFLMGISGNKDKKQLREALCKIAEENKSNLSLTEYWTDSAMGLDENTNHLFFVHTFNGKETLKHLNLKEYKFCKVNNFSRNIKDSNGDHRAIDKLEIELTPLEKGKRIELLEIFNSDGSKFHTYELAVAEKWTTIINKRVCNHA
jgi:hypothetical protein